MLKDYYQQYIKHLQIKGFAKKTIDKHRLHIYGSLSHSIQDIELQKLKLTDIALILQAGRTHGKYGEQDAIRVFRVFLNYLMELGKCIPIDINKIKSPTVPSKMVEYLTIDDIKIVRDNINTNTINGLRTLVLFEILISTGMRISEALSLNIKDINWHAQEAIVINCKNHEKEKIYFSNESLKQLKKYLERRHDNNPALFISNGGARLLAVTSRHALSVHTKKASNIIGKHIHHHLFRSTFSTLLLQGGADIKTVQGLARHKSERTTLRHYLAFSKSLMQQKHRDILANI